MAQKKRDYKAEYQRRISSHAGEGLSRSQLAGHPRKGERSITQIRAEPSPPSRKPTPLFPRSDKEKAESLGGVYNGRRNAYGFKSATFDSLDSALAFARGLPKDAHFYFAQTGILIFQSPLPKVGEVDYRGERVSRSLSTMSDKTHLNNDDVRKIRDTSAKYFSITDPSTFTVHWKVIGARGKG